MCVQMANINVETIFCKISLQDRRPIVVGSVYRPPDTGRETCSAICGDIMSASLANKRAVFWVGGDFNLPDINWKDEQISGKNNPLEINQTFFDTIKDLGLSQIIDSPSRGPS